MSEWISVEDRLPEMARDVWAESEWVLIFSPGDIQMAKLRQYDEDAEPSWIIKGPDGYDWIGVTHWMPLPAPPA